MPPRGCAVSSEAIPIACSQSQSSPRATEAGLVELHIRPGGSFMYEILADFRRGHRVEVRRSR
jgi:hypothetical protein